MLVEKPSDYKLFEALVLLLNKVDKKIATLTRKQSNLIEYLIERLVDD